MKKAKVLLTAIVMFAVVGGALAFKARSADKIYVDTNGDGVSDTEITGYVLSSSGESTFATASLGTQVVSTFRSFTGN